MKNWVDFDKEGDAIKAWSDAGLVGARGAEPFALSIKAGRLFRDFPGTAIEIKREADQATALSFPASSEVPIDRWFGTEVLVHEKAALRSGRLDTGSVPLLFNHDWDDPVGMVDRGSIRDGRLMVDAHLFATARAQEVGAMLDGGLRNVSIGYQMHTIEEDTKTNTYRATDWELLEVSVVTIPADPSVGIGRSEDPQATPVRVIRAATPAQAATAGVITMAEAAQAPAVAAEPQQPPKTFDAAQAEANRKTAILNLCRAAKFESLAQGFIQGGTSLEDVGVGLAKAQDERQKDRPQEATYLDMGRRDTQRYSLMRAIRAAANKDWTKAGLELEANQALSKKLNRMPRSDTAWFVPLDVLMRDLPVHTFGRRDMTVAGVSGSNYLVGTDNLAGSFIDLLRNTSVGLRMGVTRLAGLVGSVTIPKMTAGNTAYWLADEATQITESQPTIGQLPLAPKNVAALTEISHQLISQSTPDAEQLVLTSIARDLALAIDVGILRGAGASGEPQGIVGTSGVGSVSGTSLAATGIIEFQTDVAGANALGQGCGYVTTAAVAGDMMVTPQIATVGTLPVWQGSVLEGTMFGFPAMSSAQMSTATMLFGLWPSVILGEWGVLELMTNPFSDFTRGLTAVRGWYTCDVGMRYPAAFSYASSIT
jgi:HK97 family phage major capsid protein/HK97 family phage prohead protease